MTLREFFRTGLQDGRRAFSRHRLLVLTFVVIFAVAGSSRFLRGQLVPASGPDRNDTSSRSEESLRSCDSTGTMFAGVENLDNIRVIYRRAMSSIVGEREKILKTPSEWKCGTGAAGEPAVPALRAIAQTLPGWHYRVDVLLLFGSATTPIARPVTFAAFGAIVSELQREYECKLTEIQDRTIAEVSLNNDAEQPAQFCCMSAGEADGCRQQTDQALCNTPLTDDPGCNQQCPVLLYMSDLASRVPVLHSAALAERQVSRVAVERTLSTLRSFEMNYAVARQLMCYQRASLDLKNEMSLLADTVSCMPKIWDAVTSIHDPKK